MASYDPSHDHVMLFDGHCHLCDGTVRLLLRLDRHARLKFAPIQGLLGQKLYRQHGLDPDEPHTMLLVTPDGAFQASSAAIECGRVLGGVWKLALVFKLVPRPLRDAAYAFLARNRYRWFGRHESCQLPTPGLRARMLD
ncbi:MAG: thiol-disulfide oxidoreductase DCC family protein [Verrucomicrobiaceae bacterium]|jgi:predicted DCC family thiol-disulfide oxidoreductase YuxK|nr:thiol-disulfide oxidoreductase DCC family protein [Verrucomicrobiaceae bacterium]